MKRKLLLTLIASCMTILVFCSYNKGPYKVGGLNRTGAAGSQATCTGSGCHATISGKLNYGMFLKDYIYDTTYIPGKTYTVRFGLGGDTISHWRWRNFGFQLACVKYPDTNTQAGTITATDPLTTVYNTANGLQLLESNNKMWMYVSSYDVHQSVEFNWTAPPAGSGEVVFLGTMLLVDDDGTPANDIERWFGLGLAEAKSNAVGNVQTEPIAIYPNPATQSISLHAGNVTGSAAVHIYDYNGRIAAAKETSFRDGTAAVNVATLPVGNYYLIIRAGNQRFGSFFIKE